MALRPTSLALHARAATYPLLLANVSMADGQLIPGTHLLALLPVAPHRLGLIGVIAPLRRTYEQLFGLRVPPILARVREEVAALRREGAHAIVLLSHRGIDDDRALAWELHGTVDLMVGGHSHTLEPFGGYVDAEWGLQPQYDTSVMLREVVESHLAAGRAHGG